MNFLILRFKAQTFSPKTISGVFKMVAEKESGIRNTPALRTASIPQKVFGAQDEK